MADANRIAVEIQDDFLKRQTRARPVSALAELIWNSLDGDATSIDVEFEFSDLAGGLSKVVVYDNGRGFPHSDAIALFGNLGGSWKRITRTTPEFNRMIHGQEGRGRYKALALGSNATWKVSHANGDQYSKFEIRMRETDIKGVEISEPERVDSRSRGTGVVVEITDLRKNFQILSSDEGLQELTEIFALYLINYKSVAITVGGKTIDPETAINNQFEFKLAPIVDEAGVEHLALLQIVEWKLPTKKTLYLCTKEGFPLDQSEAKPNVGDYSFSAYLKSSYITDLHNNGQLSLAAMDAKLGAAIRESREKIKACYRERAAEQARTVVEQWKKENVYPYVGETSNPIEAAERQVFDIVAATAQSFSPDLGSAPKKARELHLKLLRHAIERSPGDLQVILSEVLDLPKSKQKELADLLQETTLASIITAAKTIADRLKFITALEVIVFDPEKKKRLKERSQLHKILAENTWVFGEEYNLWVNDGDLRRVLGKHKKYLDDSIMIDDPVAVVGKKRGIVDLMFSRTTRRHRADDIEHMVVELKAPSVVIGADETAQIKRYANAVATDERFHTVNGVRWHFWVVSNRYDELTRQDIEGGPNSRRRLILQTRNISVGVKTWGELIEENRARLQFFQEHLQHNADQSAALRYLQERHSEFLTGVIVEDEAQAFEDPDHS